MQCPLLQVPYQPRPQGFSLKKMGLREKPWGRGWSPIAVKLPIAVG